MMRFTVCFWMSSRVRFTSMKRVRHGERFMHGIWVLLICRLTSVPRVSPRTMVRVPNKGVSLHLTRV